MEEILNWKLFSATSLGALVLALAVSCGGGATTGTVNKSPFLVGAATDLSGPTAAIGRPYAAGFQTYAKWRNDHGGINGHPLNTVVLDDAAQPDQGVSNAKEIVQRNPIVVLAHSASAVFLPQQKVYDAASLPVLSYTPTDQLLTNPNWYTVGLSSVDSYLIQAAWVKKQADKAGNSHPKVSLFTVDSPTQTLARKNARSVMESFGFTVAPDIVFPVPATDVSAEVLKLRDQHPDYVISGALDSQMPAAFAAMQRNGITVPVINYFAGNSEATFKAISNPNFYSIREFAAPVVPPSIPALIPMEDAAAKYKFVSDMTSVTFTKGWVAGMLVNEALSHCGDSCTPNSVKTYWNGMTKFDTQGLGPTLGFTATDHRAVRSGQIYQWSAKDSSAQPIDTIKVPGS